MEAMMLTYGHFWGLYQRLKQGASALVLTCCETGLKSEKLFTHNCVVLQNLGGCAHFLEAAEISLAVHRARRMSELLDVVALTHEGCAFRQGASPVEHAHAQLLWLSRHPMLTQAHFHCCHVDRRGQLWVGDLERRQLVSPLSLTRVSESHPVEGDLPLFS
jgi:hypothetical protein